MIVQVLAHRTDDRAGPTSPPRSAGDVSDVIDLVEYDLAAVSTLDPATGERLLLLDVPIEQRAEHQRARTDRARRLSDHGR